MKQTKNLLRYLLFFAVIQIITLSTLYLFKKQELDSFMTERQTEIKGQYTLISHAYQQRMKMAYERLSTPEVLTLMEQASVANKEERSRLRQELYSTILPLYQHLLKNHFQQIHFHFTDGTSFLRMHQPQLFDDQLAGSRPSVMLVNSAKKPVVGYDMGRHWQAYRSLFPLSTAAGHHLGSVEIGLPFSTLLNDLMNSFPGEYRFIVGKQMAAAHLDAADLRDHFTATSFAEAFLSEAADQKAIEAHSHPGNQGHISEGQLDQINQAIQKSLAKHLPAYQTVSLPLFLADKAFLVHLLPIHDISGEPAGYLMAYEQSPTLMAMKGRYTVGYLLVTAFSFLLIAMHSLYTTKLLNRLHLQQKLQQELNESHAELDQIFNTAADGMRLVNLDGVIKNANKTFASLVHLPLEQLIGQKCHEVFSGPNCHTENCPLRLILKGAEHIEDESKRVSSDGTTSICLVTAVPFYNCSGELTGIIEDFRDITDRKRLEQQFQSLSITDELTGLCNRRGFMNLAQHQLGYVKRGSGEVFVIFADLDNMKWINDTLGHEAGDKALILTARLLRTTVRDTDVVGRMGGDEFAVLLTSASSSNSEAIVLARLEHELAEINKVLPPEQQIAISFGVAHDRGGASLEELLVLADAKMYAVKSRKKAAAASKSTEPGVVG
ncbi:MAG: diguanylate cyclase [Deltaproteobacteria bacterium]|nr:diguanylate cyclase [Deltaproteobacteria bacterium]